MIIQVVIYVLAGCSAEAAQHFFPWAWSLLDLCLAAVSKNLIISSCALVSVAAWFHHVFFAYSAVFSVFSCNHDFVTKEVSLSTSRRDTPNLNFACSSSKRTGKVQIQRRGLLCSELHVKGRLVLGVLPQHDSIDDIFCSAQQGGRSILAGNDEFFDLTNAVMMNLWRCSLANRARLQQTFAASISVEG